MSPICAQSPLLQAPAHHAQDHPREDDPFRAAGQHPAGRQARYPEGDLGEQHHLGLRSCRLPRA
eukprot:6224088-Alexandrium_andersonii.AAC.1